MCLRQWMLFAVLVTWMSGSPLWAAPSFDEAMVLYSSRQHAQAREAFLAYAAANPNAADRPDAEFYAARCLYEAKSYDDFTSAVQVLRAKDPAHPALEELTFLTACAVEERSDHAAAAKCFSQFAKLYPHSKHVAEAGERAARCRIRIERDLPSTTSLRVRARTTSATRARAPNTSATRTRSGLTSDTKARSRDTSGTKSRSKTTSSTRTSTSHRRATRSAGKTTSSTKTAAEATTLTETGKYFRFLQSTFELGEYKSFLSRSQAFMERFPRHGGNARLLFLQMQALRKEKKYAEARTKAKDLLTSYPTSSYAKMMGGVNGRTEDQAAFDFAQLMKDYHARKYKESAQKCEQFLNNYPNNWRAPEVWHCLSYACFHGGENERFEAFADYLVDGPQQVPEKDVLLYLQIIHAARQGQPDVARERIARFRQLYPSSKLTLHVLQGELEASIKYGNLEKLDAERAKEVPELLDRCLGEFAPYKELWYSNALELGHDFYKHFDLVSDWEPFLREQLSTWRTRQPNLIPCIYFEMIHHAQEQHNHDKVVQLGKEALPLIPANSPYNARIRGMVSDSLIRKDDLETAQRIHDGGSF